MADWTDLEARIRQNIDRAPTVVELNVGGTIFQAFKDTLLRVKGSYFHALLGSGVWNPDSPGNAYFLDLDPDIFRHVFKFLRTGTVSMDDLTPSERGDLKAMMEYLSLDVTPEAPTLLQWDADMHPPEMGLSKDMRTIERLKGDDARSKGAVAKSPLLGSFRLRVDCIQNWCGISAGPKNGCDLASADTASKCYRLRSDGILWNKGTHMGSRLPHLKAGDVVTLERTASSVQFTVNDGPTHEMSLADASEELYPIVFMRGSGTKMTILDATEA